LASFYLSGVRQFFPGAKASFVLHETILDYLAISMPDLFTSGNTNFNTQKEVYKNILL
jgi:hypothetical protein